MIAIVKLYRKFISPLKPPCCRFTPTCSQYALEAFTKRGFFVGFALTTYRILRCNPFSKGGEDPVPEKPVRRSKKANGAIGDLPLVLPTEPYSATAEEADGDDDLDTPTQKDSDD